MLTSSVRAVTKILTIHCSCTTTATTTTTTMVTLRARAAGQRAAVSHAAPPPPETSIARRFVHHKSAVSAASATSLGLANGKKTKEEERVVHDETDKGRGQAKRRKKDEKEGGAEAEMTPRKRKTAKKEMTAPPAAAEEEDRPLLSREEVIQATTIEYPRLPFDLDAAVAHLRRVDVRFHPMLDTIELKPYEELVDGRVRELDLFKTLATSILGQQVSWLAARAIVYRFVRLFHPHLPEKPDFNAIPREELPFPHPIDVCQSDDTFLRSAGLSGAKVKYVKDVARRFSDGRLDARKIITLDEETCISELVQIKGVGRWTAEMLLMFALRRGDILPVGDLGVQRGMVLFFTSDRHGPLIADKKKKEQATAKKKEKDAIHDPNEKVPVVEEHMTESQVEVERVIANVEEHELGPHVQAPNGTGKQDGSASAKLPPLPEGVTASVLKTRRDGKKAKGNVYLTPPEMEALAAPWAPFRSLAVYMMWALVD